MSDFGRWNRAPPLWPWFKKMQERVRSRAIACDYSNDLAGYLQFAEDIGPIPRRMRSPTVGRIDHDRGYVADNFRWQEKSDNTRECAIRSGFAALGNEASRRSPNFNARQIVTCPRCGQQGKLPPMQRWHFEHCRSAPA
jgi:hypothetical protein